ncbi:MAG: HAD family hydrolase [Myxococcota bacterium]
MGQSIAFFDLDRTVLATNSATHWVRREVRLGHLKMRDAARAALWIALYQAGFAKMDATIRDAVTTLKNTRETDLRERTQSFWDEIIAGRVRPGAVRSIREHREAGERLALLTTSSIYLAEVVAEALGMDDVLANRFEVIDGVFTGLPVEPLCFGAGKLVYAQRLAEQTGADLKDCTFYTDSFSDLPAMEGIGKPVAVHPDPRLARTAKKRGWPIVDWD